MLSFSYFKLKTLRRLYDLWHEGSRSIRERVFSGLAATRCGLCNTKRHVVMLPR